MTTPVFAVSNTTFDITLTTKDLSTKRVTVTVRKLPQIIKWNGNYFTRLGETYYEQVSGEDLDDIKY